MFQLEVNHISVVHIKFWGWKMKNDGVMDDKSGEATLGRWDDSGEEMNLCIYLLYIHCSLVWLPAVCHDVMWTCTSITSYCVDADRTCFNVKTEADCMILERPHDDKPAVGMLLHSFICLQCFIILPVCISGWLEFPLVYIYVCVCPYSVCLCLIFHCLYVGGKCKSV